jgi:hypothetical protein
MIDHCEIRPNHLAIQSLLCGFLAFEGFINLVGEEVAKDVWENERAFFSRDPFRGIIGKVKYLFTKFSGVQLREGEEPFQTFKRMKRTRDDLAHNRVFCVEEITSDEDPAFLTKWDAFESTEKVEEGLRRLKELAEMIRLEAVRILKEDYQLSHLHYPAFEGPIGNSTGEKKD